MEKPKRKWDLLSKEERRACIREIIVYFQKEHKEEIGLIAAESILDFFLQTVGVKIYNGAVEDTRKFMRGRFEDLQIDIDQILK